jgi:hypothetical protein
LHGKQKIQWRAREYLKGETRAIGAVQSALGVGGCGRDIFVLSSCSLQFAKAGSAATLLQQENNNTADA